MTISFKKTLHSQVNLQSRWQHQLFKDYITMLEGFINSEQERLEQAYNEDKTRTIPEYHHNVEDYYEDLFTQHFNFNPTMLYHSSIQSMISYFENSMVYVCDTLTFLTNDLLSKDKHLKPPDYKRNVINNCVNFLEKNFQYKSPTEFTIIDDCRKIRNKIVHQNGMNIPEKDFVEILPILLKYPDSIDIKHKTNSFQISDRKILLDLNDSMYDMLKPMVSELTLIIS